MNHSFNRIIDQKKESYDRKLLAYEYVLKDESLQRLQLVFFAAQPKCCHIICRMYIRCVQHSNMYETWLHFAFEHQMRYKIKHFALREVYGSPCDIFACYLGKIEKLNSHVTLQTN